MTTTLSQIRTRDVVLGQHTLHVNETGDPAHPTVLWLHGSGPGVSAISNWEKLITGMAGEFHHVAPDLLGFADSSHPDPAPVGTAAFARLRSTVLLHLLDELRLDRVHLVGNSMGGMIALDMLTRAPERFDRVVLMGSGGSRTAPTPELIQMVTFYRDPSPTAMRALLTNFVYDTSLFAGRLDEIADVRVALATRPEVQRSHLATFNPAGEQLTFTPEQLATITHPVLVVHGREDKLIPAAAGVYFASNLPDAQLHIFPHAGHWVQIEQVDRFMTLAQAFFTGRL